VEVQRTVDLERLVAPLVAEAGLELFDVELTTNPTGIRVTVDHPDGIDFDVLGELSRRISDALDASPLAPRGHYELEVSSPGVERPLRKPEHFVRAVGEMVKVRTVAGSPGDRRVDGLLSAADETGITVLPAGERPAEVTEERQIAYAEIERARTVFDWREALADGKRRARPDHDDASGEVERAATR
jgi:ribosome maturation factor RimP